MADNANHESRNRRTGQISAPRPMYIEIAESILERIESGELSPGSRLSSERDLGRTLRVTRATARQALKVLEDRGLLYRRRGQGTYVADPKIERQAGKLVPFTRGMQRRGYLTKTRLIKLERIPAESTLARELEIPVGASVFYIIRVREINHGPVLLENLWVPAARFPQLERFDLSARSLYEVMETEYGVKVSRAKQSLEPVAATEYEASHLKVKPGTPLMLERRVAMDEGAQPVERARDLFRGDRFRFVTEIAPLEL